MEKSALDAEENAIGEALGPIVRERNISDERQRSAIQTPVRQSGRPIKKGCTKTAHADEWTAPNKKLLGETN